MRYLTIVVIVSLLLTFYMYEETQGFQFTMPGQWANSLSRHKKFSFTHPGQWGTSGKRSLSQQCDTMDYNTLQDAYQYLLDEVTKVEFCLEKFLTRENEPANEKQ